MFKIPCRKRATHYSASSFHKRLHTDSSSEVYTSARVYNLCASYSAHGAAIILRRTQAGSAPSSLWLEGAFIRALL